MEFKLKSKRRVDVIGLNKSGKFVIVEIKSSVNDFRSDKKWHEYQPFADQLYFAVANGFPIDLLPKNCGVIIADAYHAHILLEAPVRPMNAIRRKNQYINFGKIASDRLYQYVDAQV